jgi:Conjugative transposon protein TcpC
MAPTFDRGAPTVSAQAATVAGAARLDARHALITVAATVTIGGDRAMRWLSVPIARDGGGGLVVDDLPSLAAVPRRASAGPVQGDPIVGADAGPISDVVTRFLRAYLVGDTGALSYLTAPGARFAASAGGLRLLEVTSVETVAPPSADRRLLLVTVRARDPVGRALYGLRYRVRLVRRDRWYVAAINGPGREG